MKKILTLIVCIIQCNFIYAQVSMKKLNSLNEVRGNELVDSIKKLDSLKGIRGNEFLNSNFSPDGRGGSPNIVSNFSLLSSFEEGAKAEIDLNAFLGSRWPAGIRVEQKIGKGNSMTIPLDLNGMNPGTTVGFHVGRVFWRDQPMTDSDAARFTRAKNDYIKRFPTEDERLITKDRIIDSFGSHYLYLKLSSPLILNIEVLLLKKEFKYSTDSISFEEQSNAFVLPSLSFSITKMLGNQKVNGFLSVTYNYSQYYGEGDVWSVLLPFGTTKTFLAEP